MCVRPKTPCSQVDASTAYVHHHRCRWPQNCRCHCTLCTCAGAPCWWCTPLHSTARHCTARHDIAQHDTNVTASHSAVLNCWLFVIIITTAAPMRATAVHRPKSGLRGNSALLVAEQSRHTAAWDDQQRVWKHLAIKAPHNAGTAAAAAMHIPEAVPEQVTL